MEPEPSRSKLLGRLRIAALFVLLVGLLVFSRPTRLSVWLGCLFVASGEAVRFWAAGHLRKTVELITSGPYRYTRNPLYLGRLLIFTGLCVMAVLPGYANLVVLLAGYAIFFGYYLPRKERVEPQRLRRTHGEAYERYFRAVPVLFPAIHPYDEGQSSGWVAERMVRNREHWMVLGLLAACLFLFWRAYAGGV